MTVLAAAVTMFLVLSAAGAEAAVRLQVPGGSPGIPAYARIVQNPLQPIETAAVVFYRDPTCVPPEFNLLDFFDIPGAFSCPLTVRGFEDWERGPGLDPAPKLAVSTGAGPVPIWIVSWSELEAAMADGVLTIGELASLPSLVMGSATSFHEILRPSESNGANALISIRATGFLNNGRSFRINAFCRCERGQAHLRIEVR